MDEIVNAVKRVTDIMSEISAASHEQSTGIEQVNTAVTQMDGMTQQNAALVEEAAAAAESLQDQAQSLSQAVSLFKLSGTMVTKSVKRSHKPASVTQLPSQSPSTKKSVNNNQDKVEPMVSAPRKAVAGGTDNSWEEF